MWRMRAAKVKVGSDVVLEADAELRGRRGVGGGSIRYTRAA